MDHIYMVTVRGANERRAMSRATVVTGFAVLALAGCGGDDDDSKDRAAAPAGVETGEAVGAPDPEPIAIEDVRACLEGELDPGLVIELNTTSRLLRRVRRARGTEEARGLLIRFSQDPGKYGYQSDSPGDDGLYDTPDDPRPVAVDAALYFFSDTETAFRAAREYDRVPNEGTRDPQLTGVRQYLQNVFIAYHDTMAADRQQRPVNRCLPRKPERAPTYEALDAE
jgi:hypothetical protein